VDISDGNAGAEYLREDLTLRQAGHRMRQLGVTTLAVRGADGSQRVMLTSDMIVREIAAGADPAVMTVGDLTAPGKLQAAADPGWPGLPPAAPALAALWRAWAREPERPGLPVFRAA
jgi:hypothetical protein